MTQDDYNKIEWVLTSFEGTDVTNYVSVNTLPTFTKQVIASKSILPHLRFGNGVKEYSSRKEFINDNIVAFFDSEERLKEELKNEKEDDK